MAVTNNEQCVNFKIGDAVIVRGGVEAGCCCDGLMFAEGMQDYVGMCLFVSGFSKFGNYKLIDEYGEGSNWGCNDSMLVSAETMAKKEIASDSEVDMLLM